MSLECRGGFRHNRRGGFRESVGAGLGTKFRYSPLTEKQNPPLSTDNGTTCTRPYPPITEQLAPALIHR
ncbi:hypothetical protein [Coleofasciculus sp.]|uniref:hypothetical protein n=1 Tax=Coleofasciculus sp. TaxID=3100458 RepID=UPI003A2FFC0C